ncbi:MAG: POTRA domain-containing protein, partial [Planctomycetota bacterium]|nr:POTRA domain-containing protein [Planctomycetota bacterium]
MNRPIIKLALITTLCTTFLLNVSAEQSTVEGKNVKAVRFNGIAQAQWDRVQTRAQTRAGRPFSSQIANEDIRRLIAAGYFCREYTVSLAGDGVEVTFTIAPEPIIDQIEFAGSLKKKHIKKFKDLIQARVGDLLRQHQINADKQAMLIELKSKGYHFVEIDQEILPGPSGGATVRFIVHPQNAVRVKDIQFLGATAFSKRKLRKILKTKIDKWYNSAKYIQENFEEDLKRLREFYRMKGWLDATTNVEPVEFTKEKKKVVLKINVNESDRYGVESLSFEGHELFTTEQLQALTDLEAAGDYSREQMQLDLKALRDLYGERGYVRSEIKVDEFVLPAEKKVRIRFSIVENEKSYVETINVFGNTRTKDIVIRREIDLIPGEEFNTVKMDGSIRRLRNLGFFEKVEAEYVPGSEENLSNVNIRVKEGK